MRLNGKANIAVLAITLALIVQIALAAPNGANVMAGVPVTKGFFSSGTAVAAGGNNTNLNVTTETQSIAWQGFFGEVIGNITLADASGDKLYDWPLSTMRGLVFSSRDSSVNWAGIAAQNTCTIDELLTGTESDRINRTFTSSSNSEFLVGESLIAVNTSCATHTYVNSAAQASSFEEVVLTDDAGTTSIYAARLENNAVGFDNSTHDFQMIVPDFSNETTSVYYFYAELR